MIKMPSVRKIKNDNKNQVNTGISSASSDKQIQNPNSTNFTSFFSSTACRSVHLWVLLKSMARQKKEDRRQKTEEDEEDEDGEEEEEKKTLAKEVRGGLYIFP